jgi:hypothetical protein
MLNAEAVTGARNGMTSLHDTRHVAWMCNMLHYIHATTGHEIINEVILLAEQTNYKERICLNSVMIA